MSDFTHLSGDDPDALDEREFEARDLRAQARQEAHEADQAPEHVQPRDAAEGANRVQDEGGSHLTYRERYKDLNVKRLILVQDDTGATLQMEMYGEQADGTTAWVLLDVAHTEVFSRRGGASRALPTIEIGFWKDDA